MRKNYVYACLNTAKCFYDKYENKSFKKMCRATRGYTEDSFMGYLLAVVINEIVTQRKLDKKTRKGKKHG